MKKFDIPVQFRSSITGRVKEIRKLKDQRKQDFAPSVLDFGSIRFFIARHFGFCYGVENAIEISYRALEENQGKNVYLISQMIHNQEVNDDLQGRGIRFISDVDGTQFIPWDRITSEDVVIVPAFGTTLEVENLLVEKGVEIQRYNTTCPFVERVWNKAMKLGKDSHTVIIHGKPNHEETRATFSHSANGAPSIVVRNMDEAIKLSQYIKGEKSAEEFQREFQNRFSKNLDPTHDLKRVGVVNQTTMLAKETQAIADYFKQVMIEIYGAENLKEHFADTRDTLCYATNDNQDSTYELLKVNADLAIVVGGYNSSNTSHLVELCERRFPTYFINSEKEIQSREEIHHCNYHKKLKQVTKNFIPHSNILSVVLTSGASCPDTLVDRVMLRLVDFFDGAKPVDEVLHNFEQSFN